MKHRKGFVSNSSSSSFIIATKGELAEERLVELFGVPESSLIYSFSKDAAKAFVSGVEIVCKSAIDLAKYYDWLDSEEIQEWHKKEIQLLESGFTLYIGSVSDDDFDNYASQWLCYADIDFESDDLIIQKEGGY